MIGAEAGYPDKALACGLSDLGIDGREPPSEGLEPPRADGFSPGSAPRGTGFSAARRSRPPGVTTGREQYGPGVKALVIMLYCQCQSTIRRIVSILNDVGLGISARQVGRFLTADAGGIVAEQQEVPGAGMETASWINVDDTGARLTTGRPENRRTRRRSTAPTRRIPTNPPL